MSQDKTSEFVDELVERREPLPADLIKKYRDQGVPEGEIAAAILSRQALSGPDAPESAMEKSRRRIEEMARQTASGSEADVGRLGLWARIRRFLRIRK